MEDEFDLTAVNNETGLDRQSTVLVTAKLYCRRTLQYRMVCYALFYDSLKNIQIKAFD